MGVALLTYALYDIYMMSSAFSTVFMVAVVYVCPGMLMCNNARYFLFFSSRLLLFLLLRREFL